MFLKELRNTTVKYFCFLHKNMRIQNQHFKLLFFRINLLFGTSEYMSTYGKLKLLLISSIYLVFSPVEIQRTLVQTIKLYRSQTSKVATGKNFFLSVYVIGKACFDESFLFQWNLFDVVNSVILKFPAVLKFPTDDL